MRVGIEYTSAVRQHAGIGRYTRNLVRALGEIDSDGDYVLFVAGGRPLVSQGRLPGRFRVRSVPISDRWLSILWQRLRLPLRVQAVTGRIDLFHSPDFVLPPVGRTPTVVTVHDLSFLRVPECFVPGFVRYLEPAVRRSVARATHILADSASTRDDLVGLFGLDVERISVLYPGVEARFRPARDTEALGRVRERYRLPEAFVLGLGTLQPRKNFAALVDAFARLVATKSEIPAVQQLHLVIAGSRGWLVEELLATIEHSGLQHRVHLIGHVDDDDLPLLYNLSAAFAMPSKYEGFGLPVLEAMACGVPVVASTASSLPEVAGEAGLLVGSTDVDALAAALLRVLTDSALRARLQGLGPQQASRFTWQASAEKLLSVYRAVTCAPQT